MSSDAPSTDRMRQPWCLGTVDRLTVKLHIRHDASAPRSALRNIPKTGSLSRFRKCFRWRVQRGSSFFIHVIHKRLDNCRVRDSLLPHLRYYFVKLTVYRVDLPRHWIAYVPSVQFNAGIDQRRWGWDEEPRDIILPISSICVPLVPTLSSATIKHLANGLYLILIFLFSFSALF